MSTSSANINIFASYSQVLLAQGSQLQCQLVNKGQDLLNTVSKVQETSALQNLKTSSLVEQISESMSRCEVSKVSTTRLWLSQIFLQNHLICIYVFFF